MRSISSEPHVSVTFKLSKGIADRLRQAAWRRSLQEMKCVSMGSLVRAAVAAAYPEKTKENGAAGDDTARRP